MYIRKSIRTYKGKTYTNYVLVESVVTPNGPRQKSICSLGDLSPLRAKSGSSSPSKSRTHWSVKII
jgi:hypothetical protein